MSEVSPTAVYVSLGDGSFMPTELARGPWSPGHQHGGAPTGLIVRELERVETFQPMRLARVTCEILAPVPIAEVHVSTKVVRPGKKVQWVEATMTCEGKPIVRAVALFIRVEAGATPEADLLPTPLPGPLDCPDSMAEIKDLPLMFAGGAVDIRIASGKENWVDPGAGRAWFRLNVPLVEGEEPTPQQRAASAADFGNGISAPLSWFDWLFVNGDLTVNFSRMPQGEWISLDSVTRLSGDGTGLTETRLADTAGVIGVAAQSLFVQAQAGASDFGNAS